MEFSEKLAKLKSYQKKLGELEEPIDHQEALRLAVKATYALRACAAACDKAVEEGTLLKDEAFACAIVQLEARLYRLRLRCEHVLTTTASPSVSLVSFLINSFVLLHVFQLAFVCHLFASSCWLAGCASGSRPI